MSTGYSGRLHLQPEPIEPPAGVAAEDRVRPRENEVCSGAVAGESCNHSSAFQIPDLQRFVLRSGDRAPPIRRHRHAMTRIRVARQRAQFLAAFQIPDLQRLVLRSGDRSPPIRTHRHAIDTARVACSVRSSRPLSRSHTFSVLSPEAETARRPSGLTATPLTEAEWPASVRSSWPLSRSHTFSVLSREAETARRPSGRHRHAIDRIRVARQRAQFAGRSPGPRPSASCPQKRRPRAARPRLTATPVTSSEWPCQRAQFLAALQIPHLQRFVPRSGDCAPPVRTSPPRQ